MSETAMVKNGVICAYESEETRIEVGADSLIRRAGNQRRVLDNLATVAEVSRIPQEDAEGIWGKSEGLREEFEEPVAQRRNMIEVLAHGGPESGKIFVIWPLPKCQRRSCEKTVIST